MALRCLMAARNSESRSGCSQATPAADRSARRRSRLLISARSRVRVDARMVLVFVELGEVALELLEHIAAHIAAGGDGQHVQEARHGRAAPPAAGLVVVVQRLAVEEIEPQEGAQPLVQRLLEHGGVRARQAGGRRLDLDSSAVLCLRPLACESVTVSVSRASSRYCACSSRTCGRERRERAVVDDDVVGERAARARARPGRRARPRSWPRCSRRAAPGARAAGAPRSPPAAPDRSRSRARFRPAAGSP